MIIGIPKEIKEQEFRVALLPSAAYQLGQRGHQVLVERNAGTGAGSPLRGEGARQAVLFQVTFCAASVAFWRLMQRSREGNKRGDWLP